MTVPNMSAFDWINAFFWFVVGFFVGGIFVSLAQLAKLSGWVFALGVGVVVCLISGLALLVMLLSNVRSRFRQNFEPDWLAQWDQTGTNEARTPLACPVWLDDWIDRWNFRILVPARGVLGMGVIMQNDGVL
jgi:Na+-transporting methylmalonyl-CoA/oxaloacetate decarboxylase gamma subunit